MKTTYLKTYRFLLFKHDLFVEQMKLFKTKLFLVSTYFLQQKVACSELRIPQHLHSIQVISSTAATITHIEFHPDFIFSFIFGDYYFLILAGRGGIVVFCPFCFAPWHLVLYPYWEWSSVCKESEVVCIFLKTYMQAKSNLEINE